MFNLKGSRNAADRSFLPEDYLDKRIARRTNFISLALFCVVTVGVIGAFLVTNRQWNDVRRYQQAINVRYSKAAQEIEQLKSLEEQKSQLLAKAELTTALIERVPRTILLAELINRMPEDITLLELEITSKRIAAPAGANSAASSAGAKAVAGATTSRSNPKAASAAPDPRSIAPSFKTRVVLVGVSNTHNNVARYSAALQNCQLINNIELVFSERTIIKNRELNKFRIEADIVPTADARRIEPLANPRLTARQKGPSAPGLGRTDPTADAAEKEGR